MVNDSCLRGHHSFFKKRWRKISLLSQPIITALNISRGNNVKFRLKEQSIQEAVKKKKRKKGEKKKLWKRHGSHMKTTIAEVTSSRTRCEKEHQR